MRTTLRPPPPGRPVQAASGTTSSGDPDMVLVGELLEDISRNPPAIESRKLLAEHYMSVGWLDAAMDNVTDLKKLAPKDNDVKRLLEVLEKKPEPPPQASESASIADFTSTKKPEPVAKTKVWDPAKGRYVSVADQAKKKQAQSTVKLNGNLDAARMDLTQGYQALRTRARFVLSDLLHLQYIQKANGLPQSKNTDKIAAIVAGRNAGSQTKACPPPSARSAAKVIKENPKEALQLTITDLEDTTRWLREPHRKASGASDDEVRDALVKRMHAVESALPEDLKIHCEHALMHLEHENSWRNYVNTETMLGDEVKDIPRANFYVTEDNYAWDMEELAQAITSNNGVFRNPLSREMFTQKDVKGICTHTHGKKLAALAVAQHEMSKGVRPTTIEHMEKLSKILLDDQSTDALPSRKAVDEFLAYIATLPELEQKAIDGLKCPAKDSHTGQAYDFTIGDSVRDAKGNKVCFHKTGDFIKQAAAHLRQNRGAPPDQEKCRVM